MIACATSDRNIKREIIIDLISVAADRPYLELYLFQGVAKNCSASRLQNCAALIHSQLGYLTGEWCENGKLLTDRHATHCDRS